jgi:hypothetical protein
MEPPLGTISFFLLCMQFATQQRVNLGLQPFTQWLKSRKANQLNQAFPRYDRYIVRDYAKAICFDGSDADGLQNEPPWLMSPRASELRPGRAFRGDLDDARPAESRHVADT